MRRAQSSDEPFEVTKTDEQWRSELDGRAYQVLRRAGTEPAWSGVLWDNHTEGVYRCAGCQAVLFTSNDKFDSGTGWPSFVRAGGEGAVVLRKDRKLMMVRTEVCCARCGGHLGHVFDDGPAETGLRYCINSAALAFDAEA